MPKKGYYSENYYLDYGKIETKFNPELSNHIQDELFRRGYRYLKTGSKKKLSHGYVWGVHEDGNKWMGHTTNPHVFTTYPEERRTINYFTNIDLIDVDWDQDSITWKYSVNGIERELSLVGEELMEFIIEQKMLKNIHGYYFQDGNWTMEIRTVTKSSRGHKFVRRNERTLGNFLYKRVKTMKHTDLIKKAEIWKSSYSKTKKQEG